MARTRVPRMEVTVWTDYICPWAYAARPHTEWLRAQGVAIRYRAYELHPLIPAEGRPVRPGGRLDSVFDHLAAECEAAGLAFNKPARSPNSRRSLELLEVAQAEAPESVAALDERLARAHWVDGVAIDDPEFLGAVAAETLGAAAPTVVDQWADGAGSILVDASKEAGHDLGVTATPAWRIGELTITGLHPAEQFRRWAGRLLA